MKGGSKLFIFTGVALALVTVLLAITMTSSPQQGKTQDDDKPGKVKVVKAAADFEPHKVITMSDIVIEEMSTDQVPPDAATDTASVLGQSYKLGAVKGDILLSSYLQAPGITNSIEPGKRAFALEMDTYELMSGLIMDGDYVDVVFDGRVDLNRVLEVQGVEIHDDGEYTIKFEDEDENDEIHVFSLQRSTLGLRGPRTVSDDGGRIGVRDGRIDRSDVVGAFPRVVVVDDGLAAERQVVFAEAAHLGDEIADFGGAAVGVHVQRADGADPADVLIAGGTAGLLEHAAERP